MPTLPDPPYNGPFLGNSISYPSFSICAVQTWTYQIERGGWSFYDVANYGWDQWPLGFYRTPLDYLGIPAFFLVTLRTDPTGRGLPYVLNPQDSPVVQTLNSPNGFGTVALSELNLEAAQFTLNAIAPWFYETPLTEICARLAVQKIPTCPPGQVWDPITETCKPVAQPPPPPPPPPPPFITGQPCTPNPGPYDDTLTTGLNCVSENLLYIQQQLAAMIAASAEQPGNQDPVTCQQLTALVYAVNNYLYAIAQQLAAANAKPSGAVDLTTVVGALGQIAAAIAAYPPAAQAIATVLENGLGNIAKAFSENAPADLQPIVGALNKIYGTIDVDPAAVQTLVSEGYLSPDVMKTIGQGAFGDSLISTIATWVQWLATKYLGLFGITVDAAGTHFAGVSNTISSDLGGLFAEVMSASETTFSPIIAKLVAQLQLALTGPVTPPLGAIGVSPDTAVAIAIGGALAAASAGWLLSFIGIDAGEPLSRIAEFIAAAISFEELRDVKIGPLIRNGIALQAERNARAVFRQELPGTTALLGLVAQGLLDPARARALTVLNGTSDELFPIEAAGAYRGLNPRQMLRLIETDLFSSAEIADELTFAAMRPASQARMLRAAPYLATASERSSLRSALETAFVAGVLSESDLSTRVAAIEQDTDLVGLVVSRARLQKLVAETKALETEYTALFVGGLLDDATYRQALAAIGLQPDMVNSIAARAEARSNVTLHRKYLAAAARAAAAEKKAIDQAAIKNYLEGNIDEAALGAALIASGVTPTQAASMVDLAVLRKAGALRWIYGLQLPPTQATLLHQRVADLTDQRKRLQITDTQYVGQLRALGLGDKWVNALQAQADALISPKTSAFPIRVGTT